MQRPDWRSWLRLRVMIFAVPAGVAVLAAMVLGARFAAEGRVRDGLHVLAQRLAGVGELRFLDLSVGFDGEIRILGLSFFPHDVGSVAVIAEEARVTSPGFGVVSGFADPGLPERIEINLLEVSIDAGDLPSVGNLAARAVSGNPFEAMKCGGGAGFQAADLADMGYPNDDRSAIRMVIESEADEVRVSVERSTAGIPGARIELSLIVTEPAAPLASLGLSEFAFQGGQLVLPESEFNGRRNRYCADREVLTPDDYVELNAMVTRNYLLERGIVPSAVLFDHYRSFVAGLGAWRLLSSPPEPVPLSDLPAIEISEWPDRLHILSSLRGRPDALFRFTHFAPISEEEIQAQEELDRQRRLGTIDPRIVVAQDVDPWVRIPPKLLQHFVGRQINLRTLGGEDYRGELLRIEDSQIFIDTRFTGGEATVPISRQRIERIQVRRSVVRDFWRQAY